MELGAEFAGEVFDLGATGVLDYVLDGRCRESRVESRVRQFLVADAGDAEAEPVELIVARRDDGEGGQRGWRFASGVGS